MVRKSSVRARSEMQDAIKAGNYQIALEWAETVLQRYKSHPEFLRAKASLLLMMGEKDKAIKLWKRALELEPNNQTAIEYLKQLGVSE